MADSNATVEAINNATGMIEQVAKAIQDASATYGPHVVDLTLESARILAIQEIVSAIAGLVIFYFMLKTSRAWLDKTTKELEQLSKKDRYFDDVPHNFKQALAGAIIAISFLGLFISSASLVDVRSWYGMARPDVYMASGIVKKALK